MFFINWTITSNCCQISGITRKKSYLNWLKLISWANNNFVDAKVILVALQQNVFSSLVFRRNNLLLLTISLANDFPSILELEWPLHVI